MTHVRTAALARVPAKTPVRSRRWGHWLAGALALLVTGTAQADCNCLDTNADGYPDRDGTCTGRSVSQRSPYPGELPAAPPAAITVTFDRELTCGQYINGDYWVVEPAAGAGITITATSPEARRVKDGFGSRFQHGFMIDPVRVDAGRESVPQGQTFDERSQLWVADGREGRLDPERPLPARVGAGQSFIKAFSKQVSGGVPKDPGGQKGCQPTKGNGESQTCVRAYMVVTALAAPPDAPSDTFRPPYTGKWNRGAGRRDPGYTKPGTGTKKGYRYADVRFEAFPRLSHAKIRNASLYITDVGDIRDSFRLPQVEILAHNQQRRLRAQDSSSSGPLYGDGGDYAPHWARVTNRAWLRLTANDFHPSPDDPEFAAVDKHALVHLLQFGIDQLHLVIDGDKMYYPDGGHYAGGYLPALMACHLFHTSAPVGYDVGPECAWLERNKAEGSTLDVGYPMWGEQTLVYRNALALDQREICATIQQRTGHSCAALGIDPRASKPLYGQKFSQRAYTDAEKDEGGQGSCLGDWSSGRSVSTHCRDPFGHIDHPGNACHPDPDQDTRNYERIIQPNLRNVALTARLFGVFREDGSGPFPNHLWDFVARRYWAGYETQPDLAPRGGSPTGYTGANGKRCAALHHAHPCSAGGDGVACYPTSKEYSPVCGFCVELLNTYPTFVHTLEAPSPAPAERPTPPVLLEVR